MQPVYAICPYCNKSIRWTDEFDTKEEPCVHCGQPLSNKLFREKGAYIDIAKSNEAYSDAKLYFDNADFREAGNYFKRALELNRNNYLANYYVGLCDVYENETTEGYNVPKTLVNTIKESVEKMDNSNIDMQYKVGFLTPAFNEIYIVLLGHYNKLCEKFDTEGSKTLFRKKIIEFLAAINLMHSMGKERLMLYDQNVANSIIGITELAITACFKATHVSLFGFDEIDAASDDEYGLIRSYYNNFVTYILDLNPKYLMQQAVDYTENVQYNKDVLLLIDNYYYLNRDNSKNYLSMTGDILDNMLNQSFTAVKLTYYTCVRNLTVNKNDPIRLSLINQAIIICYEVLKPRLFIDGNRRVSVVAQGYDKVENVASYLNLLLQNLPDNMKRSAGDVITGYYDEIYDMLKIYFSIVVKNYSKIVNKLKKLQNEELRYYRNFLFQMACACTSGLTDIVKFHSHKTKPRLNLLKLCKTICEEFFLLCDYNLDQIEKSGKYSQILVIYSALDADIEFLSKKK